MIVQETVQMKKLAMLKQLAEVLRPLAAKYKAPRMADKALEAIGWWRSKASYNGGDALSVRIKTPTEERPWETEFWQIYEYKKAQPTLADYLALVEDHIKKHEAWEKEPEQIYCSDLIKFIEEAIGAKREMTATQFQERKALVLASLEKATWTVRQAQGALSLDHDAFDAEDESESA